MTRSFRHSFVRLSRASLVMAALLLGWQASSAPVMRAAATNDIVISQVYGGGGNSGATLKNDFIELFNRGTAAVPLAGWSVQYAAAAGTSWQVTNLTGSIAPGHYYLVQEAQGSGGTTNLPAADATGAIPMGATAGKVALVSTTTALTGACPTAGIVDFVGFGTTVNCFEGTGPTPAPSNTTAVRRTNVCSDADSNSTEFVIGAPNPRNSASPTTNCSGPTNPSGVGAATPATVPPGGSTLLKVTVTPGQNPTSTGISVTADLTSIGGSASQAFFDNGTNGDVTPNDNVFSFQATPGSATGQKTIPVTIGDAQARSASASITLRVQAPVTVVISQLYGGGANVGSTYHNDYVELYNASSTSFDLAGWTLQYASATGNGWAFTTQPIGGVIGPGQYLLVGLAAGSEPDGDPLPPAQIEDGGINMSATTGKIALVRNGAPLSGNCPLSDPDIVDFVGYGTSADCHEGAANAPAPSNTTALFRKTGGQQDTDENGADFVTGLPEPRQTAPIVEIGPAIFNTDPLFGADKAPRDASITLNFTEAVDVDGAWYDITCASTGSHHDATTAFANGGRIHIITPNTNFQPGESCTVTIFKDHVHDQDDDDSAPNTDTLATNYALSFTVVADTDAPYPPDVHLTMGNPSGAEADLDTPNNYLMAKREFALSYNRDKGTPNWVSWHLATEWTGDLPRVDTFRADPAVPPDWYRVQATDFLGTGFDRGHMTPNADRDLHLGFSIDQATFLMTNMVPQAPNNNQGAWADFENYLRSLLPANDAHGANELYIVSGPAGVGGTGSNGFATTLADGHVTVPAFTWKVVLVLPKQGGDDVGRVDASTRTIAIIMPNENTVLNTSDPNDWKARDGDGHYLYLTTVDAVEALSGYDFFSNVPEIVQNAIEAGVDGVNPPGVVNQLVTGEEDHDVSFTLQAVSSSSHPITFTIVTPPAHGVVTGSDAGRTYTPEPDFNGTDSFTFRASDGTLSSNVGTVTIGVQERNDAPTIRDDTRTTDEDVTLSFQAQDLTLNDSTGPVNESGQTLTVTQVTPTAETHGVPMLDGGTVTYVPDPNFNGVARFLYTACDDGFTAGAADPLCATATVTVMVNPTNDPPVLVKVPPSVTTPEQTEYSFVAQATDADNQALVFSLVGAPAGATIDPITGRFSWTPTEAQGGLGAPYPFKVRVSDGEAIAEADIAIEVGEVNAAPTLAPIGSKTVELGGTLAFTAAGSDADIPVQALHYSLAGAFPAGATIDANTGEFRWTPVAGQVAMTFAFQVVVTDGAASASSSVTARAVDTTAPWITSVSATPDVLFPPIHLPFPVGVTVAATDLAGTPSCRITNVTNDETGTRDAFVIAPLGVLLVAERNGRGDGRIYTIEVTCTDASGNAAKGTTTVSVPHDRGHDGH